jgi:hypothetical protein
MRVYYFYRYVNQSCSEVKFLGTFETDKPILELWDLLFQVFCGDGSDGGMFVRNSLI